MSQDSVNSLELMSQETYDVLQSLLDSNNPTDYASRFRIQPYGVHLTDENNQDNVQINIERLFSFPRVSSMKSEIDFSESPPDFSNIIRNESPQKAAEPQQIRPMPSTDVNQEAMLSRHCIVPPNTDFPGPFGFTVGFQEEKGQPVKSAPWTYSTQLEKLFVKMRSLVPIRFIFNSRPPPGSYIKCVVVYKQPEHFKDVVERCMNHMTKFNDGHCAPKHLLRCECNNAKYETCPFTGRHNVTIPVRDFEAGSCYFTEMIQYMCFNSCPGGLNRRLINTIFSLENNGQVLGRKVLDSRICACPGRDRGNEETGENKKVSKSSSHAPPQPQSEVVSSCQETPPPTPVEDHATQGTSSEAEPLREVQRPSLKRSGAKIAEGFQLQTLAASKRIKREEDEEFTISVRGREKYELLLKIKEGLDMMDIVPQSFLDAYRKGCPPCGPNWFIQEQMNANKESPSNNQNTDLDSTPPSTFPLSQLSRTSSNVSTRSNPDTEYSTVRFTFKRTMSLERKGLMK